MGICWDLNNASFEEGLTIWTFEDLVYQLHESVGSYFGRPHVLKCGGCYLTTRGRFYQTKSDLTKNCRLLQVKHWFQIYAMDWPDFYIRLNLYQWKGYWSGFYTHYYSQAELGDVTLNINHEFTEPSNNGMKIMITVSEDSPACDAFYFDDFELVWEYPTLTPTPTPTPTATPTATPTGTPTPTPPPPSVGGSGTLLPLAKMLMGGI